MNIIYRYAYVYLLALVTLSGMSLRIHQCALDVDIRVSPAMPRHLRGGIRGRILKDAFILPTNMRPIQRGRGGKRKRETTWSQAFLLSYSDNKGRGSHTPMLMLLQRFCHCQHTPTLPTHHKSIDQQPPASINRHHSWETKKQGPQRRIPQERRNQERSCEHPRT